MYLQVVVACGMCVPMGLGIRGRCGSEGWVMEPDAAAILPQSRCGLHYVGGVIQRLVSMQFYP